MVDSRFKKLLDQRAASAERTRKDLDEALDRFEQDKLQNLPAGSKLSLRNLAVESGHSKDTPLSRYRQDHPKAGEYRFPEIVSRIKKLNKKGTKFKNKEDVLKRQGKLIKELREQILMSAQVNNLLDAENFELKLRNGELETEITRLREENAQLRQVRLKVVS